MSSRKKSACLAGLLTFRLLLAHPEQDREDGANEIHLNVKSNARIEKKPAISVVSSWAASHRSAEPRKSAAPGGLSVKLEPYSWSLYCTNHGKRLSVSSRRKLRLVLAEAFSHVVLSATSGLIPAQCSIKESFSA
ncbi:hypothetical protein BDV10DRAFT_146088 [Aspergillus recurvatus]